jgi:sRNA-binding protein
MKRKDSRKRIVNPKTGRKVLAAGSVGKSIKKRQQSKAPKKTSNAKKKTTGKKKPKTKKKPPRKSTAKKPPRKSTAKKPTAKKPPRSMMAVTSYVSNDSQRQADFDYIWNKAKKNSNKTKRVIRDGPNRTITIYN